MDSVAGNFHMKEINGKPNLVYHLDGPTINSGKNLSFATLFLCPVIRMESVLRPYLDDQDVERSYYIKHLDDDDMEKSHNVTYLEVDSSPYFVQENETSDNNYERLDFFNHYVFPLYWCNNIKDGRATEMCNLCHDYLEVDSDYYLCDKCDKIYHKECVESPFQIRHPYHPKHLLKLCFTGNFMVCLHCENASSSFVYYCSLCDLSIHPICAQKSIPFVIEQPKRHEHPLTFFTRHASLDCNVCGLIKKSHSTYVCLGCNFVAHKDCVYFPNVIRISRHYHRVSFTSSLPRGKWVCGVCRKNVDSEYGAYTCKKCDDYVVHSRCALREDVWDGIELEEIPEEDDIEEVLDPFERISDGLILHFLHDHQLKLETSGEVYDECKICEACVTPIYEGDFYSCIECDFILHDKCANAPRKIRHHLHPHPLTLKVTNGYHEEGHFSCDVCYRECSGFIYECTKGEICFSVDVRCGLISEPFDYQGHEHPLFLALDPQERPACQVCRNINGNVINCIECDFIRCLSCVTLPYMVRYKHDKHFLTLSNGEESDEADWCEICEKVLVSEEGDEEDKRFYTCKYCCTTLHIECLLGRYPYLKPRHDIILGDEKFQIQLNNSLSRPTCDYCLNRCVDKIFFKRYKNFNTYCCYWHAIYDTSQ